MPDTSAESEPSSALPRIPRAALTMLAGWMGGRYYRTFRIASEVEDGSDAVLMQRDRRVGVTLGALWEGLQSGANGLEALVGDDLAANSDANAYALWVPPGGTVPEQEPALSNLRLIVSRGLSGLDAGERREVRLPVTLRLAKIDAGGAYMSVSGGLASQWTQLSEGITGAFHLDSRDLHRLPGERAETEILISHVRDRATLLEPEEITTVEVHDYWLVSRLLGTEPRGLTVVGAPSDFDPNDGAVLRRLLRKHVTRAMAQRQAAGLDLGVLLLMAPLAHIEEERVTAALRGMNPASYGGIDLIALVADGAVRQVLQPRSLPWET